ncbi:MAG: hypothetical protein U0441_35540 [Polyangiaceae bacterium]
MACGLGLAACAAPAPSDESDADDEAAVGEAAEPIFFVDDLKVTVASYTSSSVTFRIENVGGLDEYNVVLDMAATSYRASDGTAQIQNGGGSIAYIWPGAYVNRTVTCPVGNGYVCKYVSLKAILSTDATPANNTASKSY